MRAGCWWSKQRYAGLNPGDQYNSLDVRIAVFPNARISTDNIAGMTSVFDFEATP